MQLIRLITSLKNIIIMSKLFLFIGILGLVSCNKPAEDLPFIGIHTQDKAGKEIHYKIGKFEFTNTAGEKITELNTANKVYVADFFFTSCPTICPVMKTQLLRVFDKYKSNKDFLILSHTIDPEHDSLSVLSSYKKRLIGGENSSWQFLRAEKMYTHTLAQKQYFVSALEDKTAVDAGGFVHSGAFVLVDKNQHIRGVYDGTKEEEVDKLINDIEKLL